MTELKIFSEKQLDKILPAVLAVQSGAIHVQKGTNNPFFKSKYADLSDIWAAIKDLMSSNNLLVSHSMFVQDGRDYINTRIYHVSGQFLESICPIEPTKKDPQGYGSAVTYMRRYSLSALLGIVTDLDDDGNDASGREVKKETPNPVKKEKTPEEKQQAASDWATSQQNFINESLDVKELEQWQIKNRETLDSLLKYPALSEGLSRAYNAKIVVLSNLVEEAQKSIESAKDAKAS